MDEVSELNREWRAIVLDKLTSVEQSQKEVRTDIVEIKTTFAKQQTLQDMAQANRNEIDSLRDKVDGLEKFKYKLIGIAVGVQAVIGAIIWLAEHLLIK